MDKQSRTHYLAEKVDRDLKFLLDAFDRVLRSLGEDDVASALPWMASDLDRARECVAPDRLSQALAMAFALLNLVEENAGAQLRRVVEDKDGVSAERGLWGQVLEELLSRGASAEELKQLLSRLHVEPVLTAHPTEAKRTTILEHYRELYLVVVRRENQVYTQQEQRALEREAEALIERLWRTGDIFLEKPDVASEVRNVNHYLLQVFPDVLPWLDRRLRHAWAQSGQDASALDADAYPKLSFGSWVGGDRDGHPLVTPQVTADTLLDLRMGALSLLRSQLSALGQALSLSAHRQSPTEELTARVRQLQDALGSKGQDAISRNSGEPWRQLCNLMVAALPSPHAELTGAATPEAERRGTYSEPSQLRRDLQLLSASLRHIDSHRLAEVEVLPVIRTLDTFGFHLARLDVRQNSAFHDAALAELLTEAGIADGASYPNWEEEKKLGFLRQELESSRPFSRKREGIGKHADNVVQTLRVLRRHIEQHGCDGIGSLIVSMTRSVSDLLAVYILAREVGLAHWEDGGLISQVPVVPLFETIADLEASSSILSDFLAHPCTKRSVQHTERDGLLLQQVMVGYSDSNKDGGIIASQMALHQGQKAMIAAAEPRGFRLQFFHGRGGTISRGAGPTDRFLRALPPYAVRGDIRLTEQGETISQKYAQRITATYNLELLFAGAARASAWDLAAAPHAEDARYNAACEEAMQELAKLSLQAYRKLVETDGFVTFFSEATPVDVIEQSRIGSRPARRSGRRSLEDLRAIPWVFSWSQARFFLSGWYGVGAGLETLKQQQPEHYKTLLRDAMRWPPSRYVLMNAITSIGSTDQDIMRDYAALVRDDSVRATFMTQVEEELGRSLHHLEQLLGAPLYQKRTKFSQTVARRQPALKILHAQQIELLSRWRTSHAEPPEADNPLLTQLLLTVNAIAAGLRTTG